MALPLPKTTEKQREAHWADVDAMLSPGFLSHTGTVGAVTLCIRNPSEADLWLLRQWHPNARSWFDYANDLITRCVWCVNGVVVIGDQAASKVVHTILNKDGDAILSKLFYVVLGLFIRRRKAERDVYAYIYETSSRLAWRATPANQFVGTAFGSLPGVEKLGVNAVQGVWTAYNKAEDQRILDLTQWSYTKNIMSCHAPKGVKKIEDRDKKELEKRLEDHQKILDRFYYRSIGHLDMNDEAYEKDDGSLEDGQIRVAHTPEELADEMHRWVTGEYDQHDRIVKEYKEDIRNRMLQERKQRERRLAQIRVEAEMAAKTFGYDTARPKVVGYSFDEVQQLLKEKGVSMKPGARDVGFTPSRRERAFDRWVEENPDAGNLVSDGDSLTVDLPGSRTAAPPANPRPKASLQEQISRRRPKLPGGGD